MEDARRTALTNRLLVYGIVRRQVKAIYGATFQRDGWWRLTRLSHEGYGRHCAGARPTRQEGGEKRSGGLRLSRPTQRAAAPARPVGRGAHDDSLRRAAGPMNHIELKRLFWPVIMFTSVPAIPLVRKAG